MAGSRLTAHILVAVLMVAVLVGLSGEAAHAQGTTTVKVTPTLLGPEYYNITVSQNGRTAQVNSQFKVGQARQVVFDWSTDPAMTNMSLLVSKCGVSLKRIRDENGFATPNDPLVNYAIRETEQAIKDLGEAKRLQAQDVTPMAAGTYELKIGITTHVYLQQMVGGTMTFYEVQAKTETIQITVVP